VPRSAALAPTHALVARENVAGRSVLGLMEYRNERPDELAIEVWWDSPSIRGSSS
jgi:hypothetical protein